MTPDKPVSAVVSPAGTLEATDTKARRLRAILVAEGGYHLRNLFGFPVSGEVRKDTFNDLSEYAKAGCWQGARG